MPTLRDVATAAGVSIGTASNAFNRPDLISDQLRDRVLGEAKRIGYAGGGARAAAAHLVALGHERVGVVAFPVFADAEQTLPFDSTRERLAGYRDGLGPRFDQTLVSTAPSNNPEIGGRLMREWIVGGDPPTAVLAMSDALAAGVLREAIDQGLRVPGELSVVGYDDVPLAAFTDPPLTTVNQPTQHKGELAARSLLEAIETGAPPEPTRTVLPARLVVRGSTGPSETDRAPAGGAAPRRRGHPRT